MMSKLIKVEDLLVLMLISKLTLIDQVEKMLRGKHGARLDFLKKRSLANLPEDGPGVREDVVKDWNHIHETVRFEIKI